MGEFPKFFLIRMKKIDIIIKCVMFVSTCLIIISRLYKEISTYEFVTRINVHFVINVLMSRELYIYNSRVILLKINLGTIS